MSEGERLYRAKCTSCHRTYEPGERRDWVRVVDKMEANRKVHLSQEERAEILSFLQPAANR
jgi:mono/diheme cytochrome c family protein